MTLLGVEHVSDSRVRYRHWSRYFYYVYFLIFVVLIYRVHVYTTKVKGELGYREALGTSGGYSFVPQLKQQRTKKKERMVQLGKRENVNVQSYFKILITFHLWPGQIILWI